MLFKLILLLTLVPLAELFLLVKLSIWWHSLALTVAVVLGTGLLGAWLAHAEGLRVLRRMQMQLSRGELPADSILDGSLVLVAGALLITPGLMTDAVGLLLLLPPTRTVARGWVRSWLRRRLLGGGPPFGGFRPVRDEPPPGYPPVEDDL